MMIISHFSSFRHGSPQETYQPSTLDRQRLQQHNAHQQSLVDRTHQGHYGSIDRRSMDRSYSSQQGYDDRESQRSIDRSAQQKLLAQRMQQQNHDTSTQHLNEQQQHMLYQRHQQQKHQQQQQLQQHRKVSESKQQEARQRQHADAKQQQRLTSQQQQLEQQQTQRVQSSAEVHNNGVRRVMEKNKQKVNNDNQDRLSPRSESQSRTHSKNIAIPKSSSPCDPYAKMSSSTEGHPYQPTDHISSLRKQAMSAPNSPSVRGNKANVVRMGASNGSISLNRRIEAAMENTECQTSTYLSSRMNEPLTDDEGGTLDIKPMQPIMRSTRYNYLGKCAIISLIVIIIMI